MTPEECAAMRDRVAKFELAQDAVYRAKKAIEEAEKLTPVQVARYGTGLRAVILEDMGMHTNPSLVTQAAEKHAPAFIEAIKAQLRAHLEVQEKKLAEI